MENSRNGSHCSTQPNENDPPLSFSDISVHIIEDDVRKQSEDQLLKIVEEFPTTPRCSPSDISNHKSDDSHDNLQSEEHQKWNVVEFRSPGLNNENGPPLSLADISVHILDDVRKQSEDHILKVVKELPTTPRYSPPSPALSDQGDSLNISTTTPQELAAEPERNDDTRLWESQNLNNRYFQITVSPINNDDPQFQTLY